MPPSFAFYSNIFEFLKANYFCILILFLGSNFLDIAVRGRLVYHPTPLKAERHIKWLKICRKMC